MSAHYVGDLTRGGGFGVVLFVIRKVVLHTIHRVPESSVVRGQMRREMKAARYLNWRINRRVNAEDTELITRVQAGMASRSFTVGPLSEKEVCLRHFCRRMRELIPQARQEQRPAAGWSHS